jgi:predicted DNA-binding transcriptional regulator AlpA
VHHTSRVVDAPSIIDDPFLSTNEVAVVLMKHPLSIHRYLREDPEFPKPVRVSANRLGWRKSVIEAYIASRPVRVSPRGLRTKKGAK